MTEDHPAPKSYPVPAAIHRDEMLVANSRFIATLGPAFNVEQARAFLADVRAEFSDATHNVPAYVVGYGATTLAYCSDDGEPSGTAGRPALAVLQGSGLGDAAVVVTRYFGGTKLGTGGLVRAYSEAVRRVVNSVPRAVKTTLQVVMLEYGYTHVERIRQLVTAHQGWLVEEEFGGEVTATLRFRPEHLTAFQAAVQELTNGRTRAVVVQTGEFLLPVI